MFKNMKIRNRINMGFGALIVILIVVAASCYVGIRNSSKEFTRYRELARDTNLAGRLQANMLMVRMNVKDFLITRSDKDVQEYRDYLKKMDGFMAEAKKEIQNTERAKKIS